MTDLKATAENYRREAKRDYSRSRTDAKRAAYWYQSARGTETTARWLSRRPDMWEADFTPAIVEERARCWRRVAEFSCDPASTHSIPRTSTTILRAATT